MHHLFQFISLLLVIYWHACTCQQSDVECDFGTTCKKDANCTELLEQLRRGEPHNLTVCGYEGDNQLVCCPVKDRKDKLSMEPPIKSYQDVKCDLGTSCEKDANCTELLKQLRNGSPHNLKVCGFDGENEWVCCPSFENKLDGGHPIELRKSQKACNKYIDEAILPTEAHILNGENANLGEFPHMVHIGYNDEGNSNEISYGCGGTLISPNFVLTAAHCINRLAPVRVQIGFVNKYDSGKQEIEVKNFIKHPDFITKDSRRFNDIGLIELKDSVKTNSKAYPACLYQMKNDPRTFNITGWGLTIGTVTSETGSSILQKANVQLVDNNECQRILQETVDENTNVTILNTQLCAAGRSDTCEGDSGGPLQVQLKPNYFLYYIVGITSYGKICGTTTPGVYTKVYPYLGWIESNVWP